MKKISVIVPVYKVEQYLDKCVSSITNQTYKNLEIILVDDGSPDSCPQMCDNWAKKDDRVKVIHKQNGGVSSARNMALDYATGDYIAFVDSDDYIEPDMYEKLVQSANQNKSQIAACNFYHYEKATEYSSGVYTGDDKITFLFGKTLGALWNNLYCAQLIKSNNLRFDESIRYTEDVLFNYYAFKNANSVSVVEDALYHYIEREGSALSSINIDWINRWRTMQAIVLADGGDNCNKACFDIYAQILLNTSKEAIRLGDKQIKNTIAVEIVKELSKNKGRIKYTPLSKTNRILAALSSMPKLYIWGYSIHYKIICKKLGVL